MRDERFLPKHKNRHHRQEVYDDNHDKYKKLKTYLLFFFVLLVIYLYVFVYSSASCNNVKKKIKESAQTDKKKNKRKTKKNGKVSGASLSLDIPSSVSGESTQESLDRGFLLAHTITGKVKKNEKFTSALTRNGVATSEAKRIVAAFESRGVFDFRRAQPGHKFIVKMNEDGTKVYLFKYFYGNRTVFTAERRTKGFKVKKVTYSFKLIPFGIGFTIRRSFVSDLIKMNESKRLAAKLLTLLNDEIQPREFAAGDTVKIIVLKKFIKKKFMGYDEILALEINSKLKGFYRIYHFKSGGYFTENGISFFRRYLHRPLPGNVEPEKDPAVDGGYIFPAEGSPKIWSISDGKIIAKGWAGNMGRKIAILDNEGTLTEYFHLSRYASKIKKGSLISRRQILGYAGYSGTTPDKNGVGIRITYKGKYVSVQFLESLRMPPVPSSMKNEFKEEVTRLNKLFKQIKIPPGGNISSRLSTKINRFRFKTKRNKKHKKSIRRRKKRKK